MIKSRITRNTCSHGRSGFNRLFDRIFLCGLLSVLLVAALSSCANPSGRLRQDAVLDIAWETLSPYTASQNRLNWEIVEARRIAGREVVHLFSDTGLRRCPGPLPPENQAIRASSEYWYIKVVPSHLIAGSQSNRPGSNPNTPIPEPIIREASFLIEPFSGDVVARKLYCGD